MLPIQDQISVATKTNLEANLAMYTALTGKTLESLEKLFNLHIAAAKASMEESAATTRQMLAVKDPQEFFTLISAQAKPNFEKVVAYGGHLANIAGTTQAEFSKAAENHFAEASRKLGELLEEASKHVPVGSENIAAIVKSAFGNASTGYEQITKTAKQAAETFGANLNAAASQFAQAVPATAKA